MRRISSLILQFLKQNKQQLLASLGVAFLVTILFLVYLFTIGIPKTQARNLYNQAELELYQGNFVIATELLNDAYAAWPEEYISDKIMEIESLN